MKETIARLMKNVPTKIRAPSKTPRQVIDAIRSERESNISNAATTKRFRLWLSIMTATTRRRSASPDLRVEAADFQRLPKTRQGRVRRRVRGRALRRAN